MPTDDLCVNAALIRCGCGQGALHGGDCSSVRSRTTLHPAVGRIHSLHGTTGLQISPFSTLNQIFVTVLLDVTRLQAEVKLLCTSLGFGSDIDYPPPQKNLFSVTDCIKTDYATSKSLFTGPIDFPILHTVQVLFVDKAHDTQIQVHWPKNIYAS